MKSATWLAVLSLILSTSLGGQEESTSPCSTQEPPAIDESHLLPAGCYGNRPDGAPVDTVVVHYISAVNINQTNPYDLQSILKIFRGEYAPGAPQAAALLPEPPVRRQGPNRGLGERSGGLAGEGGRAPRPAGCGSGESQWRRQ